MTALEVLSTTKQDLAGMSVKAIKAFRAEAAIVRSQEDAKREEASSPIGRRMLKHRKDELAALRARYYKIQVAGHKDGDIVRDLIRAQAREEYLTVDIARMENAENHSAGVDTIIQMCNSAITAREQGGSSNR